VDSRDDSRAGGWEEIVSQNPRIQIYLTPLIPLSFKGEGGLKLRRGASPLLDSPINQLYGKDWHMVLKSVLKLLVMVHKKKEQV